MTNQIDQRITSLGITLPNASTPAANYVPYVISGKTVYISGQIPVLNGDIKFIGTVGKNVSVDEAVDAAQLCALNIIAQLKEACEGDLLKVKRCIKLGGFVACTPDFTDQPKVINGASDMIASVFEEKGTHARFAVGAPSLPRGVAVEVDAIFELV